MKTDFQLQLAEKMLPILALTTPEIALSTDPLFQLEVLSDNPLNEQLLKQTASINLITEQGTAPFFHGIITDVSAGTQTNDGFHYQLCCQTDWSLLSLTQHTRIFVKKTVQDIVNQLLTNQAMPHCPHKFQAQYTQKPLASTMQYRNTDAHFLQNLLAEQGFVFRFITNDNNNLLEIVDDIQQLKTSTVSTLPFPVQKSLQRTDYSVLSAEATGRFLTRNIELRNHTRRKPDDALHIQGSSNAAVSSHGRRYEYGINYPDRETGERLQHIRQQALNALRTPLKVTTDCPQLCLGQVLTISDNPQYKQPYRVISICHHYEAEYSTPIPTSNGPTKPIVPGYRNRLTLIPADMDYHIPIPKPVRVAMLTGVIEGNGSDKTFIDKNGNYHVRFDQDENTHPSGQASAPITAAQPGSGPNAGLHFPLLPGTRVVLYCINGDVNRPIIGGTLSDDSNPNMVNNANHSQHLWQTNNGHQTLMDDDTNHRVLRINTPQQQNQLRLQSHGTPSTTLSSAQGSLHINAGQTLLEQAGQTVNLNAGGQHPVSAQNNYKASTATDNLNYHAGKNMVLTAEQQLRFTSTSGDHNITSNQDTNLQTQQDIAISAGNNLQLRSEQQNINIIGAKGIHFIGEQGFTMAQAGGKIELDKTGDLTISAPAINIIGQNILLDSSQLQEGGQGQAATPPVIPPLTKHWISAQYIDEKNHPITNLPYTITTPDGIKHTGTLDAAGKTERLAKLTPGTAKITFGEKDKLEQQLATEREKLQTTLNILLIKAKAQATKDKAVMVHASWIEKHWLYSKAVISSTAKGAWNVAKAIPKGLIDILGEMAKVQQLDNEGKYAAMSGNAQMQNQAEQQMVQLGNQEYGWIDKTITFIDFLFKDEQTRDILETFAKDYYNSESKLMVSKQTAEAFGGFAMAIVAAIVTKKVTAFAPEVAGTDAFSELGPEIDNIASTLKEIDQCEEVSGAEVDREHVVKKSSESKHTNFEILQSYTAVNPGPLGSDLHDIASTFSGGRYNVVELRDETILYRVWSPGQSKEFGGFWSLEKPLGTLQSKIDYALKPEWGEIKGTPHRAQATQYTTIKVPKGTRLFVGKAANQGGSWIGGGSQVLVQGGVKPDWKINEGVLR